MNKNFFKKFFLIFTIPFSLVSCGIFEDTTGLPEIKSYYNKKVFIYNYEAMKIGNINVYHFNNSNIGYYRLSDFIYVFINDQYTSYLNISSSNKMSLITNTFNKSTLTIDYVNQTMTYSSFDQFLALNNEVDGSILKNKDNIYNIYKSNQDTFEKKIDGNKHIINLSNYHITAFYKKNEGYLPINMCENFLGGNYRFYYTGNELFQHREGNNETTLYYNKKLRELTTILNNEYMEYCYNLLAITLDNFFGLKKRTLRVNNEEKYFLKDGAYNSLAPYKNGLLSLNNDEYDQTLNSFFNNELDDGGHSCYKNLSVLSKTLIKYNDGSETENYNNEYNKLKSAREKTYYTPSKITNNPNASCYFNIENYNNNKIAYVCLDSFSSTGKKPNKDNINSKNYYADVCSLLYYSNLNIKNQNIKNVVIDLSMNGGGYFNIANLLCSWISGYSKYASYDSQSGSLYQNTLYGDINLDGKIDNSDYIGDDINIYIIASRCSFSAANFVPVISKNNRSNVHIIGSKTGGGSCIVNNYISLGLGNFGRISSNVQLGYINEKNEFVDDENGLEADFYKIEEASQYYNHSEINKKIIDNIN